MLCAFQRLVVKTDAGKRGRQLPGIFNAVILQPGRQFVFSIGLVERAHRIWLARLQGLLLQLTRRHSVWPAVMTSLAAHAQADLLHIAQVFPHLRSSAPRSRSRIIQLVHQAGGHGTQRNQLFPMQFL